MEQMKLTTHLWSWEPTHEGRKLGRAAEGRCLEGVSTLDALLTETLGSGVEVGGMHNGKGGRG